MEIKIRKVEEIYIIDVDGDIDLFNAQKLKDLIPKMLSKNVRYFVINLEKVDYIDSTGMETVLYICGILKEKKVWFAFTELHGLPKKIIELTKLTTYFPVISSVQTALEKLIG